MKITTILFFSVLCFMGVSAQTTHTTASQEGDNNFTGTNTHTGSETFSAINGFIYVDGVKYPATGAGLQAAVTAAGNGCVYLPPGTIAAGATSITVSNQLCLRGAGGPGASGGTVITSSATPLFSIATNQGVEMRDFTVTGTANPIINVAAGGASGQTYGFHNLWLNGTAGITVGASAPFVIVDQGTTFRCTQFDLNIGAATDAYIDNVFFNSSAITSAQGHILLQAGAANVHIYRNTFLGTNTTIPDITIFMVGGTTNSAIFIEENKFGQELTGTASSRILLSYSGAGTATFNYSTISNNFVANSIGNIPDFVKLSSNSISLLSDHFDRNSLAGGPGTGYVLDAIASPPASQLLNTAWGNSFAPGNFLASVNNPIGFMEWSDADVSGNGQPRITGELAMEGTTPTKDACISRSGVSQIAIGSCSTIGNAGGFLLATGINLNHTANTGYDIGFNFSGKLNIGSAASFTWGGTTAASAADTGLSRSAAGVVEVGNGTVGDATGTLKAAAILSSGTAAALTGTGACATITTQTGGSFAGRATCTGTTGASTLTITPGTTAPNGWVCNVQDQTTRANLFQQTATVAASCTLTVTSVTQNDVFVFSAFAF